MYCKMQVTPHMNTHMNCIWAKEPPPPTHHHILHWQLQSFKMTLKAKTLLQSFWWDFKPRFQLCMTYVDGTLNLISLTLSWDIALLLYLPLLWYKSTNKGTNKNTNKQHLWQEDAFVVLNWSSCIPCQIPEIYYCSTVNGYAFSSAPDDKICPRSGKLAWQYLAQQLFSTVQTS